MTVNQTSKPRNLETSKRNRFDLEDRCLSFAKQMRSFLRKLPKDIITDQDIRQLTRSSGSVGANYLEANESLSKKDFVHRVRIAKKEARESIYWLELLPIADDLTSEHEDLLREIAEIMHILGAIEGKVSQ